MTCYQQYNLLGEKIFPQAVAVTVISRSCKFF